MSLPEKFQLDVFLGNQDSICETSISIKYHLDITVQKLKEAFNSQLPQLKADRLVLIIGNVICRDDEDMFTCLNKRKRSRQKAYIYLSSRRINNHLPIKSQLSKEFINLLEDRYDGAQLQEKRDNDFTSTEEINIESYDEDDEKEESEINGWACPACTFINIPTRPGCEQCTTDRPSDYVISSTMKLNDEARRFLHLTKQAADEEIKELESITINSSKCSKEEAEKNLEALLKLENQPLVVNTKEFDCQICLDTVPPGEGVVLRSCFHEYCRECLRQHILQSNSTHALCPKNVDGGGINSCEGIIEHRESKALLTENEFNNYLSKESMAMESMTRNSFHCRTNDCKGWAIVEDEVNIFKCPICQVINCLCCKLQHHPMSCKEYQDDLRRRATRDDNAKADLILLQNLLKSGEAMKCPTCDVIIQKKDGCDWMKCTMCKTEICWATRGPRWGPKGHGDISGGCQCGVNKKKCHPNCGNCH